MTETTNTFDQLAEQLRAAATAYYDGAEELMSDAEYDDGIAQLRITVAEKPELREKVADLLDEVAGGQSAGGDVVHPVMMGSMNKVLTIDAVKKFVAKVAGPVVLEPKLDGLAARAVYTDGELSLVARRGDGRTGEDVTEKVRDLRILPETVNGTSLEGKTFELRGEIYMPKANLPLASDIRVAAGGEAFSNTRNAASGMLTRGDKAYAGLLNFSVYGVLSEDDHGDALQDVADAGFSTTLKLLEVAGFKTVQTDDIAEVLRHIESLGEHRESLPYPIDGAVVKAVRSVDRVRLGEGSSSPNWAVAFKYDPEVAATQVTAITTDVGRTGRLSITVEFNTVRVGDANVNKASGHNVDWMLERGLGVGSHIAVKRANDVIPYVAAVFPEKNPEGFTPWAPPENDPLGRPWNKDSVLWRSTSPELAILPTLDYALSRDALDVEHVGEELLTALVDQGMVSDLPGMYDLTEEQLAELKLTSGRVLGKPTAKKIMAELEKSKTADWNRVITALGIRATGRTMGRRLAKAFPTMEKLRAATVDDLAELEGIAKKKAEIIFEGLGSLAQSGVLDRLAATGMNMGTEPEVTSSAPAALDGESVVVTGKVGKLTRTQVQELIESLGGRASSSVSKTTTLLVAEAGSTSSKVKKAEQLGIRIITPDELLAL